MIVFLKDKSESSNWFFTDGNRRRKREKFTSFWSEHLQKGGIKEHGIQKKDLKEMTTKKSMIL